MSAKHTPGPWRWELNEEFKSVALVGGKPRYDKTVMDFVRYGMGHAAPRFNDLIAGNQYNIMERCEKYGVTVQGREHHSRWFKDLSHPDARLIAAAPDLLEALQLMLEQFTKTPSTFKDSDARCKAHAAIRKALGEDA